MPPHNNDTERAMHHTQRNSRPPSRGRKTLSMLLTFVPGQTRRLVVECLLDPDWDLFERAGETPYSLTDPDQGIRCSNTSHRNLP